VIDSQGREIVLLADAAFAAGRCDPRWNNCSVTPGVYFVCLATPIGSRVRKIVVAR
jgi:hypothetical protein